jgi:hypothetical protein
MRYNPSILRVLTMLAACKAHSLAKIILLEVFIVASKKSTDTVGIFVVNATNIVLSIRPFTMQVS